MKKDIDLLFKEREPFHFVQARVGDGLFKLIEEEAETNGQSVAEFLRDCIGLRLLGEILKKKSSFDPQQKEVIANYQAKLGQLTESLIKGAKRQRLLEQAEREARQHVQPMIKDIVTQGFINEAAEEITRKLFPTDPSKKRIH